jgi:hypothetical protein
MSSQVECSCWCERTTVLIPVEFLKEGRTESCSPACGPGCTAYSDDDDHDRDQPATARPWRHHMNRFEPKNYQPDTDSSPGFYAVREVYPDDLILAGGPGVCPCGCGEPPLSKRGLFCKGHDIRLRGKLIRAAATDAMVVIVSAEGGVIEIVEPAVFAGRFDTRTLSWRRNVETSAAKAKARGAARDTPERRLIARAMADRDDRAELIEIGKLRLPGLDTPGATYLLPDGAQLLEYVGVDGTLQAAVRPVGGDLQLIGAVA